jgi:hypothetical protein
LPDEPISYFGFVSNAADLTRQVQNLRDGFPFGEMLIGAGFPVTPEQRLALEANAPKGLRIVDCVGLSVGDVFNRFYRQATSQVLVFDAVCGLRFEPGFAGDVRCALRSRPRSICTTAVRFRDDPHDPDSKSQSDVLLLPIGDIASQYATACAYGLEVIAMRAETVQLVGPFESYNLSSGILHEYVSRAILSGVEFQVIPEAGIRYEGSPRPWEVTTPNYDYMKSKSLIDSVPLPLKRILLYNLGQGGKARFRRIAARKFVANAGRGQQEIAWLTNANAAIRGRPEPLILGTMLVGFDPVASRLQLGLYGWGYLRVLVNDEELIGRDDVGSHLSLSTTTIDVLPLFEKSDRLWLKIYFDGDGRRQERTVALQKFEDNVYFISAGRHRVLWGPEFEAAASTLRTRATAKAELRTKRASPPASDEAIAKLVVEARKLMRAYDIDHSAAHSRIGFKKERQGGQPTFKGNGKSGTLILS